MTIVSNDPVWWPAIDAFRLANYFTVAAFVGLTYDWALTFGQEVELIWRQRWSLMTVLYIGVRYLGIIYAALSVLYSLLTIPLTDTCWISIPEHILLLNPVSWILNIVLEVLAMCLAVWIAVKHFRGLRRHSTGGIVRDCFKVLMKNHVLYFASFVAVSCLQLIGIFSPTADEYSPFFVICDGLLQVLEVVQMFVLGPRLILVFENTMLSWWQIPTQQLS
ncbi:hypothetical protein BDR07DRAFT_1482502 [Suillus spraguei]|nr:hypothetical protein BDR07DRAFT_1482502 [Suillus spraguei]